MKLREHPGNVRESFGSPDNARESFGGVRGSPGRPESGGRAPGASGKAPGAPGRAPGAPGAAPGPSKVGGRTKGLPGTRFLIKNGDFKEGKTQGGHWSPNITAVPRVNKASVLRY